MKHHGCFVETTKRCSGCGEVKPHDAFSRSNQHSDGRQSRCKTCTREYQREWAKRPENQERQREATRRSKQRYPERRRARDTLKNAIRRGDISRPDACDACGSVGSVHGHHEDYSKPLEVRWLCGSCHEAVHHAPTPAPPRRPNPSRKQAVTHERDQG